MKAKTKKPLQNQQAKTRSQASTEVTTFSDHVTELRHRSMWLGLFFLVFSALAYNYHDALLKVIMAPLQGEKLVYLTPGGGFSFIFLICMYAGLLATIPVLMYHLHAFIKPALPLRAQRSAFHIILAASILTLSGVLYGYFIAIPAALQFLMNFAGDAVTPNLTADSYLNFFLAYIAGLAVLSLLPLILMFVHWIKPLKPSGLLKSERWVILFSFVAAALITPTPDIVNQLMIALPVIAIYQIGVIGIFLSLITMKRDTRNTGHALHTETIPDDVLASVITPRAADSLALVTDSSTNAIPKPMSAPISLSPQKIMPQKQTTRSVDGFRGPSRLSPAPRSRMPQSSGLRRNIDGVVSRRPQPSQN
jgi:sec-independent protein translocase protein TatC